MKKTFKLTTLLLALAMVFSFGTTAFANGTVTYNADAEKFFFAPGAEDSLTSLFENFLNVMPGDTLTESIVIKNEISNQVKVKVYMRSLGAQEDTNEFLSQMNLTVTQTDDSILFDAPADQTAQLTDWVYLGTVYSGGEINLDVTLEVPITMGDDFQHQIGYIDWEFKIEEFPIEPTDPAPDTGDSSDILLYAGIMGGSLVLVVVLLLVGKKRKEKM